MFLSNKKQNNNFIIWEEKDQYTKCAWKTASVGDHMPSSINHLEQQTLLSVIIFDTHCPVFSLLMSYPVTV